MMKKKEVKKETISKFDGDLPFVSVIVPVYNAERYIDGLIDSLLQVEYPKDRIEFIIVDNNSRDRTREIIRQYPVILLEEKQIQSSYAARNCGIRAARGEILAFTDADCNVTPRWVLEGVGTILEEKADLVGGEVEFVFSSRKTTAELYDSVTHLQVQRAIDQANVAPTANLFVKASLFEKIGPFPDWVASGGDVQWTSLATEHGFSLKHAAKAVVRHPTRPLKELLKKRFRVGTGLIYVWLQSGRSIPRIIYCIIRPLFPPRLSYVRKQVKNYGSPDLRQRTMRVWFIAYLCNFTTILGLLTSLPRFRKDQLPSPRTILRRPVEDSGPFIGTVT